MNRLHVWDLKNAPEIDDKNNDNDINGDNNTNIIW